MKTSKKFTWQVDGNEGSTRNKKKHNLQKIIINQLKASILSQSTGKGKRLA